MLESGGRVRTLAEAKQRIGLDEQRPPGKARRTVRRHKSIGLGDGGQQALLVGLEAQALAFVVCRLGFLGLLGQKRRQRRLFDA